MSHHVIFAAPFLMETTLRFIRGAAALPGVDLTVVSQEPLEKLPRDVRAKLAGHWRIDDALSPLQLADAATELARRYGAVHRYIGVLEQLQVPLAMAREALGIDGLSAEAAQNFRDKSRMKSLLRDAGLPCARHALAGDIDTARQFVNDVGFPVIVKPPAGAGSLGTYRLDSESDLAAFAAMQPHSHDNPLLYEEFVHGTEYSFDSVMVDGEMRWHSVSRYSPSPLVVLENPWIQWCVMLPRDISGSEFEPIREAGAMSLTTLGLRTGLSHMEWFRLPDGRIAVSEVGARPPGAQITSLLSYAHDTDFFTAWPRLMIFDEFEPPPRSFAAGAAYIRGQGSGRVKHIYGLEEAQQRFGDLVVEAKLPVAGQAPSDSYEGDGYIIVRHPETSVVETALSEIVSTIRVELA